MADLEYDIVVQAIETLLDEVIQGPDRRNWLLNQGDIGFLGTLRRMTPDQAIRHPIPHRACAAGHAHHIWFHLNLLNRAYQGEPSFANANWASSWEVGDLTADKWLAILDALEHEVKDFRQCLAKQPTFDITGLTATLATIVHIGYHLGAVRQLVGLVK